VLKHHFAVTDVGYYAELLGGKEREKALKSVSDQRLAGAQNVQKLLGSIGAALGPKAGADASGHDDTIGVFHRIGSFLFFGFVARGGSLVGVAAPGYFVLQMYEIFVGRANIFRPR
jgi:hypothetical protein